MTTNFTFPNEWTTWMVALASVLHQRSAWRFALLVTGIVFANGRRTITSWLRAAGISNAYESFYYFIGALARKSEVIATILFEIVMKRVLADENRVLMALDDSPTKRYGPKVQGAGIHHNPTPGPSKAKFLYGHVWVTLSVLVRHGSWGTIMMPAAQALDVPYSTTALAIAWGDAWTNLVQPFWALPLLAVAKLNIRDIMGYTTVVLFVSGIIASLFMLFVF